VNIAKEYLKQVETLDTKIQQKKIELDSLKDNAIGLGALFQGESTDKRI